MEPDRPAFLPPPPSASLALRAYTTSLYFRAAVWLRTRASRLVAVAHRTLRNWRGRPLPLLAVQNHEADRRLTEVLTSLRAQQGWCMADRQIAISTARRRAAAPTTVPGRRAG
jgi:hypothetical protein